MVILSAHGVELCFIHPGKLMQIDFIERFNGSYRRGVLDMYAFRTLTEFREHTKLWFRDYMAENLDTRLSFSRACS